MVKKCSQWLLLRARVLIVVFSSAITIALLQWMLGNVDNVIQAAPPRVEDISMLERFAACLEASEEGEEERKPVFTLSDSTMVAPMPNPQCFGQTENPSGLQGLLAQAEGLLEGQGTFFSTNTPIKESSTVHYYLDETIFAVSWKQVVDGGIYTFSEVKIAHPSQFRRFFADNQYGSGKQYTTTEMSQTVNAVVSSSGDYYGYRSIGIVVNNGQIFRDRGHYLDTCYIDDQGEMLFTFAGEITDTETLQRYIDANHVRFSLSFGPVMIQNGENCVPDTYNSGEIDKSYARAALCQLGHLHYLLVAANLEDPYFHTPTVWEFAENLVGMGIPKAYALDGGQTAAIAMNHQLMNTVSYGAQRKISDIIYFATAMPEGT